jgi:hypothetical protein
MAHGTRYRSRFSRLDIPNMREAVVGVRFNKAQHRRHHGPSMLLYSQTATLADALVGSFLYVPFACKILTIKGTVQEAPSGDFAFDVLEDSQTIFHTSPGPVILSGETEGQEARPDRRSFQRGTKLYVTVTTFNGAIGPLHVVWSVEPGYHN